MIVIFQRMRRGSSSRNFQGGADWSLWGLKTKPLVNSLFYRGGIYYLYRILIGVSTPGWTFCQTDLKPSCESPLPLPCCL